MKPYIRKLFCFALILVISQAGAIELPDGIIASNKHVAPEIRLPDMDGHINKLTNNKGQWVFVHFWASWCGPCRKEMPGIQNLVTMMKGKKLAFMIINTAESEDTIFTFLGGVAPQLNSLLDKDGTVTEQWQPRGLPATYLVDPTGVVRFQALGGRPWQEKPYTNFLNELIARHDD